LLLHLWLKKIEYEEEQINEFVDEDPEGGTNSEFVDAVTTRFLLGLFYLLFMCLSVFICA